MLRLHLSRPVKTVLVDILCVLGRPLVVPSLGLRRFTTHSVEAVFFQIAQACGLANFDAVGISLSTSICSRVQQVKHLLRIFAAWIPSYATRALRCAPSRQDVDES